VVQEGIKGFMRRSHMEVSESASATRNKSRPIDRQQRLQRRATVLPPE
jgi:hypothetical protein